MALDGLVCCAKMLHSSRSVVRPYMYLIYGELYVATCDGCCGVFPSTDPG